MLRLVVLASLAAACLGVVVPAPQYGAGYIVDTAMTVNGAFKTSFTIVMPSRNMDALKKMVLDRSDPRSDNYGLHMTLAEIDALTLPEEAKINAVAQWLEAHGIEYTIKRDSIVVQTTIAQASALFQTTYRYIRHPTPGVPVLMRAGDYHVPDEVYANIAAIFGLHGLPLPPQGPIRTDANSGFASVTPTVLYQTYSVGGVSVNRSSTKNIQSVGEFQGQLMDKTDLVNFFKNEVPNAQAGDDQVYAFVGGPYQQGYGIEAELDIQFIMGVAPGIKTAFWGWQAWDFCGDLNNYTTYMLAQDTPNVNSISYGWQGPLSQLGCQDSDIAAVDVNWAKLAALGVTILIASGDSGSGYTPSENGPVFWPAWPSSSPWVLSVGATCFVNQAVGQPEMASDQFGSGGGFSAMFNTTDWQSQAVAGYLKQGPTLPKFPPAGSFPVNGRATPDVSGLGEGYEVYTGGGSQPEQVGGTSASTPMWAALISLINEARIQAGKPTMGFINPFIYQCGTECYFDVVLGTNAISRGGTPWPYGFACAPGWDAATGLGTPHFDKILAAAMKAVEGRTYPAKYIRQ